MEVKYNPFEDYGPYAFAHSLSTYPYGEAKYAPRLHVQAYHMSRGKQIHVRIGENEMINLEIPKDCKLADTKRFVAENEAKFFHRMKEMLDNQLDIMPEPFSYESTVPFLGNDLPINPISTGKKPTIGDDAFYLHEGLSGEELREAALELIAEQAYGILKPKLDHFAKRMGLGFSSLEIDDGRRTFGTFNINTKEVFLSRRLLMLSEPVIDFLIVHELAHNESHAHGKEHDAVMGGALPNFDDLDDAFNESVSRLIEQGWV